MRRRLLAGMVSAIDPGSSGPGSKPWLETFFFSHKACLDPGIQMGTGEFHAAGNPAIGAGGGGKRNAPKETLFISSGPMDSCVDLTFVFLKCP